MLALSFNNRRGGEVAPPVLSMHAALNAMTSCKGLNMKNLRLDGSAVQLDP